MMLLMPSQYVPLYHGDILALLTQKYPLTGTQSMVLYYKTSDIAVNFKRIQRLEYVLWITTLSFLIDGNVRRK